MAATGTMTVSSEQLRNTANQFNDTMSQVKTITGEMCELVNGLKGKWETSSASVKYYQRFDSLKTDIDKFAAFIHEYVDDLNDIAAGTERTERENDTAIDSLATDIIV